jgi:hypothetical protein
MHEHHRQHIGHGQRARRAGLTLAWLALLAAAAAAVVIAAYLVRAGSQ